MQSLSHQFLTWARSKPADETYDFYDIHNCALCQFCDDAGLPYISCGDTSWTDRVNYERFQILPKCSLVVKECPHTFGALASRLEAELAK